MLSGQRPGADAYEVLGWLRWVMEGGGHVPHPS